MLAYQHLELGAREMLQQLAEKACFGYHGDVLRVWVLVQHGYFIRLHPTGGFLTHAQEFILDKSEMNCKTRLWHSAMGYAHRFMP